MPDTPPQRRRRPPPHPRQWSRLARRRLGPGLHDRLSRLLQPRHAPPPVARQLWDPDRLADAYGRGELEGISILGGEPFEQAAACARLARRARDPAQSVVTYSGYTASASLRASTLPEVQALLAATDLLIAGPYIADARNDGRGWHGSTNQELVFLTSRYNKEIRVQFDALDVVELRTDGTIMDWTGIPAPSDTEALYNLGRRR
jgi:hypothetical protein